MMEQRQSNQAVTSVPIQAQEAAKLMREEIAKHRCYFCGCTAHIFDEVFQRFACIDCADVDHGGGHI